MFVFFLIIHLILATIFYFFHDITFGGYAESIIFLIAGFLFFFYFSPFYIIGSKEKPTEKQSNFLSFINKDKLKNIIPNSRKLLYSGAVILFYLSIYGIFYSFALQFDFFIIGISGFLFLLFIVAKYYFPKEIISLAFRTNTLFFSAYVFVKLIILLVQPGIIDWVLIVENILFFISGICILLWDTFISQKLKNTTYLYLLGYLFLSLLFYIYSFVIADIHTVCVLLGTILSVIYFEYISKIPQFKKFDVITKYF
jgi:hypothetical protein